MTTSCEKYELLLIERQEGALPRSAANELEPHLAACADCRDFAGALESALPVRLRAELPAKDPGDAFFVRTRNVVWDSLAQARSSAAPAAAEPGGVWARFRHALARIFEAMFVQRRGLATAGVAMAAVAVITVALWPRAIQPPPFVEPASMSAELLRGNGDESSIEGEGVMAEIGSLNGEEMKSLANKLVIEIPTNVRTSELEDEPEGLESELESLSPEELKAFDVKVAKATREAKGA